MSVGTPCICHRSAGPADFIEHDVDGLLVDAPADAAAFAREAARVLADAGLHQTLRHNAYAKSSTWSTDRVLSQLESLLSNVL
jgi:glycosyltransferase involved in cell wall biosynthesis